MEITRRNVMRAADMAADCYDLFREANASLRNFERMYGRLVKDLDIGYNGQLDKLIAMMSKYEEMLDNLAPDIESCADEIESDY